MEERLHAKLIALARKQLPEINARDMRLRARTLRVTPTVDINIRDQPAHVTSESRANARGCRECTVLGVTMFTQIHVGDVIYSDVTWRSKVTIDRSLAQRTRTELSGKHTTQEYNAR